MIDIEKLTLGELREIAQVTKGDTRPVRKGKSHGLKVGECVFICTVTKFFTGRIVEITASDIRLADAAWIFDTGRFSDALKSGTFSEIEPYPDETLVSRGGIIDISPWPHPLPRAKK